MRRLSPTLALVAALAACSQQPAKDASTAASVTALGETQPVGTGNGEDAADDPAIWRNPDDPAKSLIVATDKKAGLHVYTLDGVSRAFDPAGRLNNVDLVDMGEQGVIVVASDRNDEAKAKLRLYRLDTAAIALEPLGTIPGGEGEAYGVCLLERDGALHAFSVIKDGTILELRVELGEVLRSGPVRTMKVPTQAEGCIADPRDGTLYVGEEDAGIWRFAAGASEGTLVAKADGTHLVADVEGLAVLPDGADGGLLVASSQGDNAYALYRLPGMEPAGRFRIAAGTFGSVEETDGIALSAGSFGPTYPAGLFVAQDGENGKLAQNFKLVSWQDIEEALKEWKPPAK
jgi:3-phytase